MTPCCLPADLHMFLIASVLVSLCFGQDSTTSTLSSTAKVLPPKVPAGEIIKKLLGPDSDYDPRVRPPNRHVNGSNMPVDVEVNAYVRSMSNIDFVKMEYSLQLTFRQSWIDKRLRYEHLGERVPRYLIINAYDLLWVPDTFFMKEAHKHIVDVPNVLFRIHPDGRVLYSERLSLVLSCPMYLQSFPMDQQVCELKMASYAFTTDDIEYAWKKESALQFHAMLNGSLPCFEIRNAYTGSCSSHTNTGTYSCLMATFHLTRQFSYYLVQIYVPSTLLVVVSWVSFWLERTAVPARVTLGVTTLLTITTQTTSLNAQLPAVSYVKAVDIWMGGCLVFIFGAVFEYAYVSLVAANLEISYKKQCVAHGLRKVTAMVTGHNHETWKQPEEQQDLLSPKEKEPSSKVKQALCGWWQHWIFEAEEDKMIDLKCRIAFPAGFAVFNMVYWSWYSYL